MSNLKKTGGSYLFGPVPSRRLGMSLGVDLVPFKTCSLDCVYCESGRTTTLTTKRAPLIAADAVIEELEGFLSDRPALDYITFSGSGEPLLNTEIGKVAHFIKTRYPEYPLALLTNGTLFFHEEARKDVLSIDVIIASLDAVSPVVFKRVNRPDPDLDPVKIIQGLIDLRREFSHDLWLEIFIVPGVNDSHEELEQLATAARKIGADKIQLNTLDRPGTESWVKAVSPAERQRIGAYFSGIEIIGAHTQAAHGETCDVNAGLEQRILGMIRRRPSTVEDLRICLEVKPSLLNECLDRLANMGVVKTEELKRGIFYRIA